MPCQVKVNPVITAIFDLVVFALGDSIFETAVDDTGDGDSSAAGLRAPDKHTLDSLDAVLGAMVKRLSAAQVTNHMRALSDEAPACIIPRTFEAIRYYTPAADIRESV